MKVFCPTVDVVAAVQNEIFIFVGAESINPGARPYSGTCANGACSNEMSWSLSKR